MYGECVGDDAVDPVMAVVTLRPTYTGMGSRRLFTSSTVAQCVRHLTSEGVYDGGL